MSRRGRRVALVCSRCDEIFTRNARDYGRTKGPSFCTKECHAASMRTGCLMVEVVCWGCRRAFMKLASEVRRQSHRRNFCSLGCYMAQVDRSALGRAGGSAPHPQTPPALKFIRAQKGGIARARALARGELRRIAMKGVAARRAKGTRTGPSRSIERRKILNGRHFVGPLLTKEEA